MNEVSVGFLAGVLCAALASVLIPNNTIFEEMVYGVHICENNGGLQRISNYNINKYDFTCTSGAVFSSNWNEIYTYIAEQEKLSVNHNYK